MNGREESGKKTCHPSIKPAVKILMKKCFPLFQESINTFKEETFPCLHPSDPFQENFPRRNSPQSLKAWHLSNSQFYSFFCHQISKALHKKKKKLKTFEIQFPIDKALVQIARNKSIRYLKRWSFPAKNKSTKLYSQNFIYSFRIIIIVTAKI
jgi:hypothetical protein